LTGNGFRLRRFTTADYAPAAAIAEEPDTACWINGMPAPDAEAMVRLCERERRKGSMLDLVIADADEDSYLGEVLLSTREHSCGEIAYVIAPEARGRGIATESVRLLTDWALASLALARIELRINPNNAASIRVAEKTGYQREGLLRSAMDIRGNRIDICVYSRLADD
jgi:RimJ/RimL family protein N-acetyltransferase